MSSIIHALTGRSDHSDKKPNTSSSSVHKVVYEDVEVKSVVSSQTQSKPTASNSNHKINALMAKLSSTHLQIDEYSRHRTEEISEAVKSSIDKVIHLIQTQQQQLLDDAQKESSKLEEEYTNKLMLFINELDQEKATRLVELEKELNLRQEQILESARKRIDSINEEANRLKMNVLKEAQAKTNVKLEEIAEKVVQLEAEDASRRLASTTKTVITTRSQADTHLAKHT